MNRATSLRRAVETIEELTEDRRARLDAVGFVWDEHTEQWQPEQRQPEQRQPEQESYLANLIRHRVAPFASGVVGGPFRKLCDLLVTEGKGVKVPQAELLHAFKEAGWVDCGRLASVEHQSKRHIFAAPDVAKAKSKSELRRAVETIDTTEAKAIGIDQQRTRNQRS